VNTLSDFRRKRLMPGRRVAAVVILLLAAALAALFLLWKGERANEPLEKVVIAHSRLPYAALAQIAQQSGFFRQEGLEAVPLVYDYGKPALEAVVAGKADFATVAETPTMLAIMNRADLAILATIQVSRKSHAMVARKDFGITAPQHLIGKRIGVTPGTSGDFYLYAYLLTKEIPREKVAVVNMKPQELPSALARGDVDAIVTWAPILMQAQKEAGGRGVTFLDDEIYTMRFNLVATKDFARRHPKQVKKMLRALLTAEEFAARNPQDAQRLVAGFCGMDLQTVSELWEASSFRVSLEEGLLLSLEDESQWAVASGLTRNRTIPNYLDFVYLDGLRSVAPKAVGITR
jgi:sulfonate transport system substrate-binding protein